MKLGFCAEAEYRWMRHDEGVTAASAQPKNLYDNNLALFEELFGRYDGAVLPYVQELLVNDIAWKMNSRIALSTHVGGRGLRRGPGAHGALAGAGGHPAHHDAPDPEARLPAVRTGA